MLEVGTWSAGTVLLWPDVVCMRDTEGHLQSMCGYSSLEPGPIGMQDHGSCSIAPAEMLTTTAVQTASLLPACRTMAIAALHLLRR